MELVFNWGNSSKVQLDELPGWSWFLKYRSHLAVVLCDEILGKLWKIKYFLGNFDQVLEKFWSNHEKFDVFERF